MPDVYKRQVEVGHIIETTAVGHLRDRVRGLNQQAGGLSQPDLVQTFDKRFTRPFFDKTTERHLAHVDDFGYVGPVSYTHLDVYKRQV